MRPQEIEALYQDAHRLREADHLDAAIAAYGRVAVAAPTMPQPHHWIGLIRMRLGDAAGAETAFRSALEREAGRAISTHGLGMALLGQGRFAEGFRLLEARLDVPGRRPPPPLPFPRWNGEDLAGKHLLIWPEEGFGDQIQYARFAKALAERGIRITWCCLPQLASLFEANLPVDIIRAEGEATLPDADFWIWSTSLPALFGGDELPTAPYLAAPARPAGGRIGVVSRGNPKQINDPARSLSPAAVDALLALPGAVSLLPEDTGVRDFLETAELISGLDLVISVDTAGAHLAGAMGKPCWVMLPRLGADWRWTPLPDRSLWYPSMRLYRQPSPGDWDSVLDRIRSDLAR